MGVSLSGIFTGIDTETIINQIIAADSAPFTNLQTRKTLEQSKQAAVNNVATILSTLQTLANGLEGADHLNYVAAGSSDSQVLTATSSATATEGSHIVVVNRLASAAKEVQAGVIQKETWTLSQVSDTADSQLLSAEEISDAAGGTSRFVFQFGPEAAVNVDLSAYDATGITLNQLVGEINAAAGYAAASAVQNGEGQYQLQVRSRDAGADRGLTVTDSDSVAALSSLAQFTKTVSGVAGADTLVGAGQFVYTYHGVTRTIQTTATTTLANLQDLINNDAGNPGVSASILDHKMDDDHQFHLVLGGRDSGADYGITIGAGTTLAGFGPGADWTLSQQAANSQIRVDGYPAAGWIERSSNTVGDVIPGVTLSLSGLSAEGVQVTVSRDTSQLIGRLQNLVNTYNTLNTAVGQYTGYNAETQTGGILQGDSTIVSLLYDVRNPLVTAFGGFTSANSTFTLAAQIGMTIDKTGKLSLDTDTLSAALSEDYQGVLNLIGAQAAGLSDSSTIQFQAATGDTTPGAYEVEAGFDSGGRVISARIRAGDAGTWMAATIDGNVIIAPDASPAKGLRVAANWDGASTLQTAHVTVRQGLAATLSKYLDQALDAETGVLALRKQASDEQIKNIDANIATAQARLDRERETLKATYARLEQTLALMDAQQAAITALTATVSSSTSS